jgi:hypothetical protein
MKKKADEKRCWEAEGHGALQTVPDQKAFFDMVKRSQRMVACFARPASSVTDLLRQHLVCGITSAEK